MGDLNLVPFSKGEPINTNNAAVTAYKRGSVVMVSVNGLNASEAYITGLPTPYNEMFTNASMLDGNLNGINGFFRYLPESDNFLIRRTSGSDSMYGTLTYLTA